MYMKGNKKSLILLIVGIFVILIVVVGATYAYFQSVNGNTTIANINTTSGTVDDLSFLTDEGITLNISEENLQQDGDDVSETSVAKATLIANNTTNEAEATYNVYILIENNEIEYSSYEKEGEIKKFITKEAKEKENLEEYKGIPELVIKVEKNENEYEIKKRLNKTTEGYDITEAEGLYAIAEDEVIRVVGSDTRSTTDEWKITIIFKNLDYNQQLNAGKKFEGKIILTKEKLLNEISTINDLVKLSEEVNKGDSKEGKYYILTKDLDFGNISDYQTGSEALMNELTDKNGKGFTPIGYSNVNAFLGNFDGLNNKISNLWIYNTKNEDQRLAFIGYLIGGSIKNLTISGEVKSTGTTPLGGLVNRIANSSVDNCINEIDITTNGKSYAIGGLVGWSDGDATITNSINRGNIITNGGYNGGIIAGNQGGTLTIDNCKNYGTIENNLGREGVGGIIGDIYGNAKKTIIKNSVNYGEIKIDSKENYELFAGGIFGRNKAELEIINSHNEGVININGTTSINVGGLVGLSTDKTIITNSYNIGEINSTSSGTTGNRVGGLIGLINYDDSTKISKIENSYNKGNINGGDRTGGILGAIFNNAKLIINRSYNTGTIINGKSDTDYNYVNSIETGGIIGQVWDGATMYILNSYNQGEIISNPKNINAHAGGIIYSIENNSNGNKKSNGYIINSYNKGKITAKNSAKGISGVDGISTISLNNVYNIGELDAPSKAELIAVYQTGEIKSADNIYYKEGLSPSNQEINATPLSENIMNSQSFVNTLNDNIKTIDLKEIDPLLDGYTLSKWKLGSNGYPTLDY